MQSRTFGKLGWPVSAVGLGTWNIGNQWGDIDDAAAWATIRAAYDHGMRLFDTAESYGVPHGLSEMRLGTALAGIRHNVHIVSKIGSWGNRTGSPVPKTGIDSIRLSGHAILGRLRTDYVDVLLCHEGNLGDPTIYLDGFEALKDEGAIRAYGISTNDLAVLKRFNVNGTCSVVQTDYSLLNLAPEAAFLPYCQEHGIAVMARGPLAKGLLSGRYTTASTFDDSVRARWNTEGPEREKFLQQVTQVQKLAAVMDPGDELVRSAIAYTFSHPAISVTIPGAKSAEQARTNAAAGETMLTEAQRQALVNAVS